MCLERQVAFFRVVQLQGSDLQRAVVGQRDLHRLIDSEDFRLVLGGQYAAQQTT